MTEATERPNRPPMSDRLLAARTIYDRLQKELFFTVSKARRAFQEAFEVPPDHPSIDQRYLEIVENHFGYTSAGRLRSWCAEDVSVPADIAIAFYLREIPGRKSKTPRVLRMAQKAQMEEFQQLTDDIQRKTKDCSAEDAQYKAARIIHRTFEWRGERRSFLSIKQMLDWTKHPTRYGLPPKRKAQALARTRL
jgi:hypothetical protein